MTSTKGFTLVELLISMTILISLIVSATFTHRFFMQQWQRFSKTDSTVAIQSIGLQELERVLHSTSQYAIKPTPNTFGYYWLGEADFFVGVTKSSLFNPRFDSAYKMSFTNNQDGCTLRYEENLLVNELPDFERAANAQYAESMEFKFALRCSHFSYLGWKETTPTSLDDGGGRFFPPSRSEWLNSYHGVKQISIPYGVKLVFLEEAPTSLAFQMPNTLIQTLAIAGALDE